MAVLFRVAGTAFDGLWIVGHFVVLHLHVAATQANAFDATQLAGLADLTTGARGGVRAQRGSLHFRINQLLLLVPKITLHSQASVPGFCRCGASLPPCGSQQLGSSV